VLKKIGLVTAVTAALTAAIGGVAFASDHDGSGDNNTHCASEEHHSQTNDGKQLIGGNGSVSDVNGPAGGSTDGLVICPSIANDNTVDLSH
jgi:hypothetical protein